MKLAGFNLADHRSITSITGPTAADFYTFQAGREILLTLEAKFLAPSRLRRPLPPLRGGEIHGSQI